MNTNKSQEAVNKEDIKKLVIARLRTFSRGRKISIGSDGEFNKDELIKHVEDDDPIGKKMVEIQLQYLQSLKEGIFLTE